MLLDTILRLSVERRVLVVLLATLAALAGALALRRLPIDAVPDVTNNQVTINTFAPALSPPTNTSASTPANAPGT